MAPSSGAVSGLWRSYGGGWWDRGEKEQGEARRRRRLTAQRSSWVVGAQQCEFSQRRGASRGSSPAGRSIWRLEAAPRAAKLAQAAWHYAPLLLQASACSAACASSTSCHAHATVLAACAYAEVRCTVLESRASGAAQCQRRCSNQRHPTAHAAVCQQHVLIRKCAPGSWSPGPGP